jgi:LysR family transcriptional regulator, nitrogen assimilation regulatory protein
LGYKRSYQFMDLKQLEYFVRVAELGSFTRAGHALGVAQPALSRQVRLLELELRQNLLVRNGRGAQPTEAGRLLLEHGRGILHQLDRAKDDLGRLRGGLSGRVAIGLPPSVARVLAVPLTRAFRDNLPQAQLSITEGLSGALQEGLISGRLDLAMLYNAQASRELDCTALLEEDLLLVCAREAGQSMQKSLPPLSLREVSRMALVIPTKPNAIRMHVEAEMGRIGRKPKIALEIDGVAAILALVAEGAGAAILSRNALLNSHRPNAYTAQKIELADDKALRIGLSLATSSQRPATQVQKEALRLTQESALRAVAHT